MLITPKSSPKVIKRKTKTKVLLKEEKCLDIEINPSYLFSDLDIMNYLKKTITNKKVYIINPCIIELINDKEIEIFNKIQFTENFLEASIILAPINIKKCHWILYVCRLVDRRERCAYYIDPIRTKFEKDEATKKCKILTKKIQLERRLKKKIAYQEEFKKKYLPQYQTNDFDCGPLVCGYAVNVAFGKSVETINIKRIRQEVELEAREIPKISKAS